MGTLDRSRLVEDTCPSRDLKLNFDGFAWEAIEEAAADDGLTVEELITFSVLYYLADSDSERIARRARCSPFPGVA